MARFGAVAGAVFLLMMGSLHAAPGSGALMLLCAEGGATCNGVQALMQATNAFTSVDALDVTSTTPALSAISGYGAVLAWTNQTPADPTAFGNLLASYYSLGGKRLVISTYSFSSPWAIAGNVMAGSFAALTNSGTNGNVSGHIVPTGTDPIFTGTNFSNVTFFSNSNYAHPNVASGASLLATDGAGINMIARSSNGVVNINVYPGAESQTNQAFYNFLAVVLTNGGSQSVPALNPLALLVLMAGIVMFAAYQMRRQTA